MLPAAAFVLALAQSPPSGAPPRPSLPAGRDTNSAVAYYLHGGSVIGNDPKQAAAAFYWASRLDPSLAEPYYGRRVALLVARPSTLRKYIFRDRAALRDPEIQRIDSLYAEALLRNPFVNRGLDLTLLEVFLGFETGGRVTLYDIARESPYLEAWMLYARGKNTDALKRYATLIARNRDNPLLHLDRALPFVALAMTDSALAETRHGLAALRGSDEERELYAYESFPMFEYRIGVLFEFRQELDSAKAAFERALLDDVRFHPAHRGLARVRLAKGDTTGALDEFAQAIALRPDDAVGAYDYAVLLLAVGRIEDGLTALKSAVFAEPYYPKPYRALAIVYQQSGFPEEAIDNYQRFIKLAPRSMAAEVEHARQQLTTLQGGPQAP